MKQGGVIQNRNRNMYNDGVDDTKCIVEKQGSRLVVVEYSGGGDIKEVGAR